MSLEVNGIASQGAVSVQIANVQNDQPKVTPPPPPVETIQEVAPPAPPVDTGRGETVDVMV